MSALRVLDRTAIDARPDRYLSFPDVARLADGSLLAAYREADVHYPPTPRQVRILFRLGSPNGVRWSDSWEFAEPVVDRDRTFWDCPRLRTLSDGRVALTVNLGAIPGPAMGTEAAWIALSADGGRTWGPLRKALAPGIVPDRVLALEDGRWLTASAYHRGPGERRLVVRCAASRDEGTTWSEPILCGDHPALVMCEPSLVSLGGARVDAYLREEQGVRHSTFVASSIDGGGTWSVPAPHPTRGHRACAGLLPDGRVLVTYRNVGGLPATCAWAGPPDARGSVPWGVQLGAARATLAGGELTIDTEAGGAIEFGHDPIEDLRRSRLALAADVRVDAGERGAAVLRGGGLLRLLPDRLELETFGEVAPFTRAADLRRFRSVELRLESGVASVALDGEIVLRGPIGREATPRARIVGFGNLPVDSRSVYRYVENRGRSAWRNVRIETENPTLPPCRWSWDAASGRMPDHEEHERAIVLEEETSGQIFEHGYTGWTAMEDGDIFVINYIRGEAAKPGIVGYRLRIQGQ